VSPSQAAAGGGLPLAHEARDRLGDPHGLVERRERLRLRDLDDRRVRDERGEALRVRELEEAVLDAPGEANRPLEAPQPLGRGERVPLVRPRRHLAQVAPDARVPDAGREPLVDQLGVERLLHEDPVGGAADRAEPEWQLERGDAAGDAHERREGVERERREVLEGVAVGEHEALDALRMVRGEHLGDGATGVVADDRRALEAELVEEVDDHPGEAGRGEVRIGVHRGLVRAHRPVGDDAAVIAAQPLGCPVPEARVDEQAVDEDDRLARALLAVVDRAVAKARDSCVHLLVRSFPGGRVSNLQPVRI